MSVAKATVAAPQSLPREGLLALAISVALLSSAFPVTKVAVSAGARPLWFALGRAGFAGLTATIVLIVLGRGSIPRRADLPALISVAVLQLAAFFALTHTALAYVPAGRSSVLSNATTVWVAPLTVLFLHESVPWRRWAAAGLGVLGIMVLVGPWSLDWRAPGVLLGHVLLLLAAFAFALGITILRRWPPRAPMIELLPWCFGLATLLLAPLAIFAGEGIGVWPARACIAMAYIGLAAAPFGSLCVMLAARSLPAMVSSVGFLATPATGLLLSTLFLGEPVTPDLIAGSALILGGVGLAAWPSRRR
jgi:drug/metabolite transporter (DMT)-like permease